MNLRAGTPARDLGLVFICGPAVGVVGALAAGAQRENLVVVLITAAAAWAIGGMLWWQRVARASHVIVPLALFAGVVLISIAVVNGGPPGAELNLFYLWATPLAFLYLSRRLAAAYLILLAICFAVVIYTQVTLQSSPMRLNLGRWVYLIGTVGFVGLIARTTAMRGERVDARFRRAFHDSPTGQAIIDPDGRYLEVNDAFAKIVGRSPSAVVGLRVRDVTYPDDILISESAISAARSGRPAVEVRKRYVRPDGSIRSAAIVYSALVQGGNGDHEIYAHIVDITDEIEATRSAQAHETELAITKSRHAEEQVALAHLGRAALDNRPMLELLQLACDLAVSALGVVFGGISKVDAEATTVEVVAAAGLGAEGLKGSQHPILEEGTRALSRSSETISARTPLAVRIFGSQAAWAGKEIVVATALIRADPDAAWRFAVAAPAPFVFSADDIGFVNSAASILGSAFARQESDERRRELLVRLVVAQEDERARIASEIHDDSLQAVAASRIQVHRLRNSLAGEAEQRAHVVENVLGDASERLRDLLFRLSPQDIGAKGGLQSALAELASRTSNENALKVAVETRGDLDLELGMRILVYRTVQEALINTLKHAEASNAWVIVERRAHEVSVLVRDDGSGFDASAPPIAGHIGLLTTRTRIDDAGGSITIVSAARGTEIQVTLPVADPT